LLPLARRPGFQALELVMEVLAGSRDPRVGPWLCSLVRAHVALEARARRPRGLFGRRRERVPAFLPYATLLRALRGHPSAETETILLLAARDREVHFRLAALGALGWFGAFRLRDLTHCLE